jgi:hypothetical protein
MNLWILTEERPKIDVLRFIVEKFIKDKALTCFIDNLRILPILDKSGLFSFTYELIGVRSESIEKIYIKNVSGKSSFMDFLVFYQKNEPASHDSPIFALEETKTDDSESRNTGVFQRGSKFVYIDLFYPNIDKTMYYNLQVQQKNDPTETNIFGSRCYRTLGVKFSGKKFDSRTDSPWGSIDELIEYKSKMKKPPKGNVPIEIKKISASKITISGRLFKSGALAHDPNIGALTLISYTLRKLGWGGEIEITRHGLTQNHIKGNNKFILIADRLKISLEGLDINTKIFPPEYWYYESSSEKLGTIFIHIVVESFTKGMSIYENHAGCERGYFIDRKGCHHAITKTIPEEDVANNDDSRPIISLPDLVLIDCERLQIINIEGKKSSNVLQGIKELDNFDQIEKYYINKYYPEYKVTRTVVLYGGIDTEIKQIEVCFLLNNTGKLVLSLRAPPIIKDGIKNLFDFWRM